MGSCASGEVPALPVASRGVEHKRGDNVCGQSMGGLVGGYFLQIIFDCNGWLRFFDCNIRHDFCPRESLDANTAGVATRGRL